MQAFYTEASDHYNCPIGAYTHGVDLPPAQTKELQGVVGTMVQLGYLRRKKCPASRGGQSKLRRRRSTRRWRRRPSSRTSSWSCGNAKQIMLLTEAAQAAGVGVESRPDGPAHLCGDPGGPAEQHGAASLGCIGNRVYTGLADDELYFALPGEQLDRVVEKLATIVNANRELEKYHHAQAGNA